MQSVTLERPYEPTYPVGSFLLPSRREITNLIVKKLWKEAVGILVATLIISIIPYGSLWNVRIVPVCEEIAFRGMFQESIKHTQYMWYACVEKRVPSQYELTEQRVYRVFFTALVFALLHLPSSSAHIASCFLGGLSFSFIKEKYDNIGHCILLHSLHNLWCELSEIKGPVFTIARRICDLAVFMFAVQEKAPESACSTPDVP